jgi:hypothetical protein
MKIIREFLLGGVFLALLFGRLTASAQLLTEGFESYQVGVLDANYQGGNNIGPNGGPGNPWWGPFPPQLRVVTNETQIISGVITNVVVPHSGTNMVRGSAIGIPDFGQDFFNLAYRLNQSNIYYQNIKLDWWFFDPVGSKTPANANYQDYVSLASFTAIPTNADYAPDQDPGFPLTRLSIGASDSQGAGFVSTNYQVQILGTTATNAYDTGNGWFNLPVARSVGWHHARIVVGGLLSNGVAQTTFFLDNMATAVLTNDTGSTNGFNCIVLQAEYTGSYTGYYDDLSFDPVPIGPPPTLVITNSGSNAILTWPDPTWTLQASTNLVSSNFVDVPSATSPYTNSVIGTPLQYFRLRK